jgi:hypothetical protein
MLAGFIKLLLFTTWLASLVDSHPVERRDEELLTHQTKVSSAEQHKPPRKYFRMSSSPPFELSRSLCEAVLNVFLR